ncbi:MAG: hypothetical protein IT308_06980 [Anaerolineaceae bacterium]|nr:hypothetical protein [Anaerolineaceae bacterium]
MKKPPQSDPSPPSASSNQENKISSRDTPARLAISLDLPPESTLSVTVASLNTEETTDDDLIQPLPAELQEIAGKMEQDHRKQRELRSSIQTLWNTRAAALSRLACSFKKTTHWSEHNLFLLSLVFYALIILAGLLRFPVNITPEEAHSNNVAADLIANHLHDISGIFLPPYFFSGEEQWLGLSVYLQAFGVALFGQSPWITRAAPALLMLLAAFSLTCLQRNGFKNKYWWGLPVLLTALPGWLLLARGTPALALTTVFFSAALAASLFMPYDPGRSPYLPFVLLALTAWSSSIGLILSLIAVAPLLVINFQSRRDLYPLPVKMLGAVILLALPLIRALTVRQFSLKNFPAKLFGQTYLLDPLTTVEKVRRLLANLVQLADPSLWFGFSTAKFSSAISLPGYALVHWAFIPLILVGIWQVIRNRRSPAARLLALMFLAAGISCALSKTLFPDALILLAPLTLLSSLGLSAILEKFHATPAFSKLRLSLAAFLLLVTASLVMTNNVIHNSTTRKTAAGPSPIPLQPVFELARQYAIAHPDQQINLSLKLGKQLDLLRRFYTPGYTNITIADLTYAFESNSPHSATAVFIITEQEYTQARLQPIIQTVIPLATIDSPQNQPVIYLVRFLYQPSGE